MSVSLCSSITFITYDPFYMNPSQIRHLLLDFGGVLFEIDFDRMQRRMADMRPDGNKIDYAKESQHEAFTLLETGRIDGPEFATQLKAAYDLSGSIEEIIDTWNYLLVGVYPGREQLVARLAQSYDIALLSNTNSVHFDAFSGPSAGVFAPMQHIFLSYEMGMRKPNDDIYLAALETMGWQAAETLFVDDSRPNIETAQRLGIQTFWVEQASDVERLAEQLAASV
jgi:glucose-1-phosphatase